jgi:hypothetical protein
MKKTSIIMVCIMAFSFAAFAQNTGKQVAAVNPPSVGPKISWLNSETVDVGKIDKGKPVTVTFEFKNTGNKPLFISLAKGQCGCTSVEYSQEPVAPDKKGFVKATYNAANAGTFNKSISVATNASEQQMQLHIKGEVN